MVLLKLGALLAAIASAVWYYAAHHSPVSGTAPLFHVGIPWGLTEDGIPDLRGKLAVVTGANIGLGRGVAQQLIKRGAHVHITCRSEAKCRQATKDISAAKPEGGPGIVSCSVLELSSLKSVKAWGQEMAPKLKELGGIDMLILNAGVMACPYNLTEDGLEWQFGVNHVAHFAVGHAMMPLVELAAEKHGDARVVMVSSLAHFFTPPGGTALTLSQLNDRGLYREDLAYGQSKLANVLYAKELQRRMDGKGAKVYVNAVHPGAVQGDLLRHMRNRIAGLLGDSAARLVEDLLLMSYWSEQTGALTVMHPATSPEVVTKGIRGQYYVPIARVAEPSVHARNATLAAALWDFTVQLLQEQGL